MKVPEWMDMESRSIQCYPETNPGIAELSLEALGGARILRSHRTPEVRVMGQSDIQRPSWRLGIRIHNATFPKIGSHFLLKSTATAFSRMHVRWLSPSILIPSSCGTVTGAASYGRRIRRCGLSLPPDANDSFENSPDLALYSSLQLDFAVHTNER